MSFNIITLFLSLLIYFGGSYLSRKISDQPKEERFFTESIFVGICVSITAYILFAIAVYYSGSYQRVIFREIARNNNAVGNLSIIVASCLVLFVFGLFIIHSVRATGNPIGNYKKILFPDSDFGRRLLSFGVVFIILIGAESTYRKFYVREMIAYYNQLVSIADIPTLENESIIHRYFDAKLAQIDSMGQFYAIEKGLKCLIKTANQEYPKRLREKFSIGEWKPYDSYLNAAFPRDIEMDEKYYLKIRDELTTINIEIDDLTPAPSN